MRMLFLSIIVIAGLTSLSVVCHGQFREQTAIRLDWDLRSQPLTNGKERFGLYSGSLRVKSALSHGWNLELNGDRKDRSLLALRSSSDLIVQQASVEKEWSSQRMQMGIVRLPFGIYDHQETYASGLIDYPMPRVDYAYSAVDWGVPGAKWSGGSPQFQIEAAAFDGRSAGVWGNIQNVNGEAVRVQTYVRDLIVGVSRWDGYMSLPSGGYGTPAFSLIKHQGVHINGVDFRYTRPHLLLRGELLQGVLGGQHTDGWYVDLYYHLPKYQKFILVTRLEALRPKAGVRYGRQITLGVRYTAAPDWIFAVNWRRNNTESAYRGSWTPPTGRDGTLFFQIYHKTKL